MKSHPYGMSLEKGNETAYNLSCLIFCNVMRKGMKNTYNFLAQYFVML